METAFTDAAGRTLPTATELGDGNISGMTIYPGLYKWSSDLYIDGSGVTLSGGANDVWIFQIAGTLTVASSSTVTLLAGAEASNIFWQVQSDIAVNTGAVFHGILLCATSVVFLTGSSLVGRVLSQTAATIDGDSLVRSVVVNDTAAVVCCGNDTLLNSSDVVCNYLNGLCYSPCTETIEHCLWCSDVLNSSDCETCEEGYHYNGTHCMTCPDEYNYFNGVVCQACPDEYYYDGYDVCVPCEEGFFYNGTLCVTCEDGYYYDGDACVTCDDGFYYDGDACVTCDDGYYYDGDACVTCDDGYYYDGNACVTCEEGYYYDGNACVTCEEGYYYDGDACVTCEEGYYYDGDACVTCEDEYYYNGDECVTCDEGYYYDGDECLEETPDIPSSSNGENLLSLDFFSLVTMLMFL